MSRREEVSSSISISSRLTSSSTTSVSETTSLRTRTSSLTTVCADVLSDADLAGLDFAGTCGELLLGALHPELVVTLGDPVGAFLVFHVVSPSYVSGCRRGVAIGT